MIDLGDAVSLLQAKRKELTDQLAAVDKALAALSGTGVNGAVAAERHSGKPEDAGDRVVPTKVKPARTLTDDHRHALNEGRRKARHSKDAAAGFARELPDPSPARTAERQPRLVKRTK
jgi:hypothetical protein